MNGNNASSQSQSQGNLSPEISTDATGTLGPPPGFEFMIAHCPSSMFWGQLPEERQHGHGHGSLMVDWTSEPFVPNNSEYPRVSEVLQKEETFYQLPSDLEKIWEQKENQVLNDLGMMTISSISSTSLSPDPLDQASMEGVDEVDKKESTWDELSMAVSLVVAQNNENEQLIRPKINNNNNQFAQAYRGRRGRGFGRTENNRRGRSNSVSNGSLHRRHSTHSQSDAVRTSTPTPSVSPAARRFSSVMPGEYCGNRIPIQRQNNGNSSRYSGNSLELHFGTGSHSISPIPNEPLSRWDVLQPIPRSLREIGQVARLRESFGFILPLCREVEIFFHLTEYRGDFTRLKNGDLVDYAFGIDKRTGKRIAVDVKNVGWELDLALATFRASEYFSSLDKATQETFKEVAANFNLIKLLLHDKLKSFYSGT